MESKIGNGSKHAVVKVVVPAPDRKNAALVVVDAKSRIGRNGEGKGAVQYMGQLTGYQILDNMPVDISTLERTPGSGYVGFKVPLSTAALLINKLQEEGAITPLMASDAAASIARHKPQSQMSKG